MEKTDDIIGFDAPEYVNIDSEEKLSSYSESSFDYIVIGSGIGGLCSAALLRWYGYSVLVVESHYLAGGCAHAFKRQGR